VDLGWAINVGAVAAFVAVMLLLGRNRPFLLLSASTLLGQLWSIVSCLYLVTGQYNFELGYTTWFNLAPASLAFYNAVFFIAAWVFLAGSRTVPAATPDAGRRGKLLEAGLLTLGSLSALYLYAELARNGIPLLGGESRQAYLERVYLSNPVGVLVTGNLGTLSLLLGVIAARPANRRGVGGATVRMWSAIIAAALLVHQVLAGNKFSSLFWIGFFFILPSLVSGAPPSRKVLKRAALVLLISLGVFASYKLATRDYSGDVRVTVASRILLLQGELYWATHDRVFNDFEPNPKQVEVEVANILSPDRRPTGLWYLMDRYGDPEIVLAPLLAGFTGGYPAITLELFGPVGAVAVQILMGALFGALAWLLLRYIRRAAYLRIYLVGSVFVLANSLFVMGNFADFFKISTVVKLALVAFIGVFEHLLRAARPALAQPGPLQAAAPAPGTT
jgi:hypothetical protein